MAEVEVGFWPEEHVVATLAGIAGITALVNQMNQLGGNQQAQLAAQAEEIARLQQENQRLINEANEAIATITAERDAALGEATRLAALPNIRKLQLEQKLAAREQLSADIARLEAPPPDPEPEPE